MLCLLLKFAFYPVNLNESASTKRYHQTLALMGATRLASGKDAAII